MIVLSVGVSGSGKTYGMRRGIFRAARRMPIAVIDRMREWNEVPADLVRVTRGARSVEEAREWFKNGMRLVIVRDDRTDVANQLDAACKWAIRYPGEAGVACPEAHRACPLNKPLPHYVEIALTQWRHHRVWLWLDTQRMPLLSKTATEQATVLKLYTIVGVRDLSVIEQTYGPDCRASVEACAAKLREGQPGWHVALGHVRVKPFPLTRDQ